MSAPPDPPLAGADAPTPLLRVVSGRPTEEELAALVAVVAVRSTTAGRPARPGPRSTWSAADRLVRRTLRRGPDAWRRSGLTR